MYDWKILLVIALCCLRQGEGNNLNIISGFRQVFGELLADIVYHKDCFDKDPKNDDRKRQWFVSPGLDEPILNRHKCNLSESEEHNWFGAMFIVGKFEKTWFPRLNHSLAIRHFYQSYLLKDCLGATLLGFCLEENNRGSSRLPQLDENENNNFLEKEIFFAVESGSGDDDKKSLELYNFARLRNYDLASLLHFRLLKQLKSNLTATSSKEAKAGLLAMFLADSFFFGISFITPPVRVNLKRAFFFYRIAAKAANPEALMMVARFHELGLGVVPVNINAALELYHWTAHFLLHEPAIRSLELLKKGQEISQSGRTKIEDCNSGGINERSSSSMKSLQSLCQKMSRQREQSMNTLSKSSCSTLSKSSSSKSCSSLSPCSSKSCSSLSSSKSYSCSSLSSSPCSSLLKRKFICNQENYKITLKTLKTGRSKVVAIPVGQKSGTLTTNDAKSITRTTNNDNDNNKTNNNNFPPKLKWKYSLTNNK